MNRLHLDIKQGQTVNVAGIRLTLQHKRGKIAKITIEAPESAEIGTPRRRFTPPPVGKVSK